MLMQPNATSNIQKTIPIGIGSVMVWGCISHDCKLDLVTVQGHLNGLRYQRDILETVVILHFNNHALATRPVFTGDNAKHHRMHAVIGFNSKIISLSFLDQHRMLTSIKLRTCGRFWVDEYIKDILQSNILQNCQ